MEDEYRRNRKGERGGKYKSRRSSIYNRRKRRERRLFTVKGILARPTTAYLSGDA